MTKGIFITATGTDVGKTYVSVLVVKKLRENNLNCGYYKPALSGAEVLGTEIIPGDAEYVVKKTGLSGKGSDYVSYMFKPAVSPHLAASIENNPIKIDKIKPTLNNPEMSSDKVNLGTIKVSSNDKDSKIGGYYYKFVSLDSQTASINGASFKAGSGNDTYRTIKNSQYRLQNILKTQCIANLSNNGEH